MHKCPTPSPRPSSFVVAQLTIVFILQKASLNYWSMNMRWKHIDTWTFQHCTYLLVPHWYSYNATNEQIGFSDILLKQVYQFDNLLLWKTFTIVLSHSFALTFIGAKDKTSIFLSWEGEWQNKGDMEDNMFSSFFSTSFVSWYILVKHIHWMIKF